MKRFLVMMGLVASFGFLAGCGSSVDENKTPEAIRTEAQSFDVAKLEAIVKDYSKAIEAKAKELEAKVAEISKIPLTEQLGDKAKNLQSEAGEITKSLNRLKDNLAAYMEVLNSKKK